MKANAVLFYTFLLSVILTGCGGSSSSTPAKETTGGHEFAVTPANQKLVVGIWVTSCDYQQSSDAYGITTFIFSLPNRFESQREMYSDSQCTKSLRIYLAQGNYAISDSIDAKDTNIHFMDTHTIKDGKDVFNYFTIKIENEKIAITSAAQDPKNRPTDLDHAIVLTRDNN